MQFSFDIASAGPQEGAEPIALNSEISIGPLLLGVLQQMLDTQRQSFQEMTHLLREHLNHSRAVQQEQMSRWRSMLQRWELEYPNLPENARKVYPLMER